jgi:hypothetical protein
MSLTITNKLPDSQISSATIWNNSLQKSTAYNGVVISSENGIVITKYNTSNVILADTTLNATTGIKIRKTSDDGVTWTDKFYVNSSGDLIFSGNMTGGSIQIGSSSSVFCANTAGIYLGSATYSSAPFRVSPSGALYANNVTIRGNVDLSSLSVNGVPATLVGDQIDDSAVNIKKSTIEALNIKASSVDAENITGTTISGKTITGGQITSNTTINVTTDATIGDTLYMNSSAFYGGIKWEGVAEIYIDPSSKSLFLYTNGGGIYANDQRIDTPSAYAVFG